jgi:hypothetical protein
VTAKLDRNALRVDLQAVKSAWDDMRELLQSVSGYHTALDKGDFSDVQVEGATVDLFYKVPKLRPTLLRARQNASGWSTIGMRIYMILGLGIQTFGAELEGTRTTITNVFHAARDQKRRLTEAERTAALASLKALQGKLRSSTSGLGSLQPDIVAFIRGIADDAAPMKDGADDLNTAINSIDETARNEALKYLKPDTMGIYNLILDWGSKILTRLRALQTTLAPLSAANRRSQVAVQGILTIWSTLTEKYAVVIDVLATTGESLDDFDILPDLLEVASESWKDLASYIQL